MNDVNATIGLANLPCISDLLNVSRENAQYYNNELSKLDGIEILNYHKLGNPSYWIYTLKVKEGMKNDLLKYSDQFE